MESVWETCKNGQIFICLLIIHLFLQILPKLVVVHLCPQLYTQTRFALATQHMFTSSHHRWGTAQVTSARRLGTLAAAVPDLPVRLSWTITAAYHR